LEPSSLWLRTICRKNGLILNDAQAHLLERYVAHLLEWNRKINLISRQDEAGIWGNHIFHSLTPLFSLKMKGNARFMDLGTGGGLPGIPLKILLPGAEFVLIDATRKKIASVQDIINKLELTGISTAWGRAEELSRDQNLVSHFDYIVARAVAPLDDLIAWSTPFLRKTRPAGDLASESPNVSPPALIALKGGDLDDEIAKARRRRQARSIEVVKAVMHGSEELPATGKKILVVRF
jgi:16S rRNA (guanine527-N7)-methyltransferase